MKNRAVVVVVVVVIIVVVVVIQALRNEVVGHTQIDANTCACGKPNTEGRADVCHSTVVVDVAVAHGNIVVAHKQ